MKIGYPFKPGSTTTVAAFMTFAAVSILPAFGDVIAPDLGSAASFGMLGGTISNTGDSSILGDVGAQTTITGFPPGTATGTVYPAPTDPTVAAAYSDFLLAFNDAYSNVSTPPTQSVADLTVDRTFTGDSVYTIPLTDVTSTANIELTFDAQNDSSEIFIIKVTGDLTIDGPLTFNLINGAQANNIYWIVGDAATINSDAGPVTWDGSILAGTTFTMSANPSGSDVLAGTINGCVFAEKANTLAGMTQVNGCASSSASPEPAAFWLVALGCLFGGVAARKRSRLV